MMSKKISALCDEINDYIELNRDNIDKNQLDIYQNKINEYLTESRIRIQKYIDNVLIPLYELDEYNRKFIENLKVNNNNKNLTIL